MIKKIIGFFLFGLGFAALLLLGIWQVERLESKQKIIETLDEIYASDPQETPIGFLEIQMSEEAVLYGHITGAMQLDQHIFLGPKTYEGQIGYHLISPVALNSGGYVLVNYGWIEKGAEPPQPPPVAQIRLPGLLRAPDWNKFTPDNSPENNVWTKANIEEMAAYFKIGPVAPMMLYTLAPISPDIKPFTQKWYPRNKHKQYAIFWFTMALVYIGVFVMFGRRKNAQTT
ncbi:MAG: SURF1 family protein [Alphaproteobacteria bacterium]|nr:SURF1 family protein [Alphaproteobacteria bacterium]